MIDRPVRLALLVAAAAALSIVVAPPMFTRGRDVSIDSSGNEEGCSALRVRFDGVATATEEQHLTVPGGTPLKLHAPDR